MSATMTADTTPAPHAAPDAPPRRLSAGIVNLLRSVAINLVGPTLLYRAVESWFAPQSVAPLLLCAAIPLFSLARDFVRHRVLDAVAVISIVQLGVSIAITLATHDLHRSLALHALQGGAIGLVFAGSILIRRPMIRLFARQSMSGGDPAKLAAFDARTATPAGQRVFNGMTLVWAIALIGQSAVMFVAAYRLPADIYLPLHSIVSYSLTGGLTWACVAYGKGRLRR